MKEIENIECTTMTSIPIVKKEPRKNFGFLDVKRDRFHDEAWAAVEGKANCTKIFCSICFFRNGETFSEKKVEIQVTQTEIYYMSHIIWLIYFKIKQFEIFT